MRSSCTKAQVTINKLWERKARKSVRAAYKRQLEKKRETKGEIQPGLAKIQRGGGACAEKR